LVPIRSNIIAVNPSLSAFVSFDTHKDLTSSSRRQPSLIPCQPIDFAASEALGLTTRAGFDSPR
jgi:hypothetical protein